jgi:two-component system, cell cycle sensor histidine kinase and response regulator CckA
MSLPPPALPNGAHIVVADEKRPLLETIVQTLRSASHRVFQAYDGQAAYELALSLQTIDLLITNTEMPGLKGPELIRQVRRLMPALPILYIRNQGRAAGSPDGLPADVPTLSEPFTAEELLAQVGRLLQREGTSR